MTCDNFFVLSCSRFHAPSLVVLDDLDKIAPAVEGDDAGPFNAQAARIAEKLEDLMMTGTCVYVAPLSAGRAVSEEEICPAEGRIKKTFHDLINSKI